MKKLSRKEIQEGLQQVPIERVILGAAGPNGIKLTKKQKAFAQAVVETGNKTEAYRRAYNTDGKRTTAAAEAQKVAKTPAVATYIQALEAAQEVREYLLPARLREMAVQKLSSMALNDELKPSEQLKALELVGKMSEVALFSERREIVHSLNSADLKAQLMDAVQAAINNSKTLHSKTKRSAAELLAEITPRTAARDAQKVASHPAVSTYIQALEAAQEVREYLLPARLREMAVQKLSSMALNDELKPSEQLKALELVGKMSEVALFSERREIVHSLNSADLKAQLMDAVQAAINNSKTLHSKTKRSAAELLAEITQVNGSQDVEYQAARTTDQEPGSDQAAAEPASALPGEHQENQDYRPPTEGHHPFFGDPTASHLHTISHNGSPTGEGDTNPIQVLVGTDIEMTPLPNSEQT